MEDKTDVTVSKAPEAMQSMRAITLSIFAMDSDAVWHHTPYVEFFAF